MEVILILVILLILLGYGFVKFIKWLASPSYMHKKGNHYYISTHKKLTDKEMKKMNSKR